MYLVSFVAAIQPVVAGVAPQGINAVAAPERVVAGSTAQHHVLTTRELQEAAIGMPIAIHIGAWIDTNHHGVQDLQNGVVRDWVSTDLLGLIQLKNVVWRLEHQAGQVR